MSNWPVEEYRALPLEEIDVRYGRYRLSVLAAEEAMGRSLRRYGQVSPIVVCLREEIPVLIDGFKRLAAARVLKGFGSLSARRIEADERGAKAAMAERSSPSVVWRAVRASNRPRSAHLTKDRGQGDRRA